jgi:hypothetical protein
MMTNSLIMALVIALGQDRDLHHLGLRHRLLPLPLPAARLLDDLHT